MTNTMYSYIENSTLERKEYDIASIMVYDVLSILPRSMQLLRRSMMLGATKWEGNSKLPTAIRNNIVT